MSFPRPRVSIVVVAVCLAAVSLAQEAGNSRFGGASPVAEHTPDLATVLRGMQQAAAFNRSSLRAYIITRDYRVFGENPQKPDSVVLAEISFVPPANKSYRIEKSTGSDRCEKIVRRILNKETEVVGDESSQLTPANYDFQVLGRDTLDGRSYIVVGLKPKRKQESLIAGRAWIDAETYQTRRIQGKPGKSPSWWVKNVEVTLEFGDVGGMWLHHGTRAVAELRLFGQRTLLARSLSYQTAQEVAANRPVRAPGGRMLQRSRRLGISPPKPVPPAMFGSGIVKP